MFPIHQRRVLGTTCERETFHVTAFEIVDPNICASYFEQTPSANAFEFVPGTSVCT
eukprot:Awhi_evm1s7813